MRFLIGLISVFTSVILITFSSLFFDFDSLIEKLSAFVIFIFAGFLFLMGLNSFNIYYEYKRIINKGIKVKAKVIDISKSLISIENAPKYILEVIYEHPKNHKLYKTFVDFYGNENKDLRFKEDEYINVLIDPKNPEVVLYTN